MCDDMNTSQAISYLHAMAAKGRTGDYQSACDLKATCVALGFDLQGVGLQELLREKTNIDASRVESLILDRTAARARKDFAESDRIRDKLAAMGVAIKDGKDSDGKPITTWEIAR